MSRLTLRFAPEVAERLKGMPRNQRGRLLMGLRTASVDGRRGDGAHAIRTPTHVAAFTIDRTGGTLTVYAIEPREAMLDRLFGRSIRSRIETRRFQKVLRWRRAAFDERPPRAAARSRSRGRSGG